MKLYLWIATPTWGMCTCRYQTQLPGHWRPKKLAMDSQLIGILILHYHANNGTFSANEWIQGCKTNNQAISPAGVNAHRQNGKTELSIRHLQDIARPMLIHSNR